MESKLLISLLIIFTKILITHSCRKSSSVVPTTTASTKSSASTTTKVSTTSAIFTSKLTAINDDRFTTDTTTQTSTASATTTVTKNVLTLSTSTSSGLSLPGADKNQTRDQNYKVPEEEVVKLIIKQLEDNVGIVRKNSVLSYSSVTLHKNHEKLVQRVFVRLRPLIFQKVQKLLAAHNSDEFNADSLTDRITKEIRPFVTSLVETRVLQLSNENKLVSSIIENVRPLIPRMVVVSVGNYTESDSNYDTLVENIMTKVRSLAETEVKMSFTTFLYNGINEKGLIETITTKIKPLVESSIKEQLSFKTREVENKMKIEKQDKEATLFQDFFSKLGPLSDGTDTDSESQSVTEFDDKTKKEVITAVLGELVGVVKQAVNTVMTSLHTSGILSSMTEQSIIIRVNLVIESGLLHKLLQNEIARYDGIKRPLPLSDVHQELLEAMLPDIRNLMISEISLWRKLNSVLL